MPEDAPRIHTRCSGTERRGHSHSIAKSAEPREAQGCSMRTTMNMRGITANKRELDTRLSNVFLSLFVWNLARYLHTTLPRTCAELLRLRPGLEEHLILSSRWCVTGAEETGLLSRKSQGVCAGSNAHFEQIASTTLNPKVY